MDLLLPFFISASLYLFTTTHLFRFASKDDKDEKITHPHTMSNPSIQDLLKMLALGQDLTESQQKQMKDYKFWKTQPVPEFDAPVEKEGPIDEPKTPQDIPAEPLALRGEFEWSTIDVESPEQLSEVYTLLHENYVEDKEATFRFEYTEEFFNWALKPPGWCREWHVGVRVKGTNKLVAFISAVPAHLRVRTSPIEAVEINFLCVHKKLRAKRLTPLLIKEVTRRVNRQDIWHALYTAGIVIPSPISTCQYTHRPLDWKKLYEAEFSYKPDDVSEEQMVAKFSLPDSTETRGLRKMELKDVDAALALLEKYQAKFDLVQEFSKQEFTHALLGEEKVVYSYVVESEDGKITDFFSFYLLPFTLLDNPKHKSLGVAYLYYYASDSDDLKGRMTALVKDALVVAKELNVDVFNALTSQDNTLFLQELLFGPGDGFLNFYLFNYRTFPIAGGVDKVTKEFENSSGVGVVML